MKRNDIKLPEITFGIGVTETLSTETIGVYANEPDPGGGTWPVPVLPPAPTRPPATCSTCACLGSGSSSVKQVQVLRNNLYKLK